MEHARLRLAPAVMRKRAHAGEDPADAPGLNHRLVDVGVGVPPLANPHDAPELRKNEQMLWVITERDEFARGGDATQLSDSLFRSAHRSSLSNRGALVAGRLLFCACDRPGRGCEGGIGHRALAPAPFFLLSVGTCVPCTHDDQDEVLQNGDPPSVREMGWTHEGASVGNGLDSRRRRRGKWAGYPKAWA